MDSVSEQRLEDRLEKGLRELRDMLMRIEEKLDAQHDKLEERVRKLEQRVAQVWIVGIIATLVIGPILSLVVHKLGN